MAARSEMPSASSCSTAVEGRHAPLLPGSRVTSERQGSRTNQVGQPRALLGIEQRVHARERPQYRVAQALRALQPEGCPVRGRGLVEALALDGVGEGGDRAAVVDRRLRALGLEVVQDVSQLAHLSFIELQAIGEKAQRSPDAEGAEARVELAEPALA